MSRWRVALQASNCFRSSEPHAKHTLQQVSNVTLFKDSKDLPCLLQGASAGGRGGGAGWRAGGGTRIGRDGGGAALANTSPLAPNATGPQPPNLLVRLSSRPARLIMSKGKSKGSSLPTDFPNFRNFPSPPEPEPARAGPRPQTIPKSFKKTLRLAERPFAARPRKAYRQTLQHHKKTLNQWNLKFPWILLRFFRCFQAFFVILDFFNDICFKLDNLSTSGSRGPFARRPGTSTPGNSGELRGTWITVGF